MFRVKSWKLCILFNSFLNCQNAVLQKVVAFGETQKSNLHRIPTKKWRMKTVIIHTWPSAYANSQLRQQGPGQVHGPTDEVVSSIHSTAVQLHTSSKTLPVTPDSQHQSVFFQLHPALDWHPFLALLPKPASKVILTYLKHKDV